MEKKRIKFTKRQKQIIFLLIVIVAIAYYIDNGFHFYGLWLRECRKDCLSYTEDLENYEDYPQFNYEREIIDRMINKDNSVKKAMSKANVEIEKVTNYTDDDRVKLTVTQCNYGLIYKNALEKANEEIKKNKVTNKKEKNDILNKYLVEEYEKNKDKKVTKTFIKYSDLAIDDSPSSSSASFQILNFILGREYSLVPIDGESNNYIIYSSFLGGLREAIAENPCDYLILKREYKFQEDMEKIFDGYIDEIKESDRADLVQCKDIINTINYKGQNFNSDSIYEIIHPKFEIIDDEKGEMYVDFNSNIYSKDYNEFYEDMIENEKSCNEVGIDTYGKLEEKYSLEECRQSYFYYKLKEYGKGKLNRDYTNFKINYEWSFEEYQEDMNMTLTFKEEIDKNGESHFTVMLTDNQKDLVYDNITGNLLTQIKKSSYNYYDKEKYKMYAQFDKQLNQYVNDLKKEKVHEESKEIIIHMLEVEDFNEIDDLILPSYIVNEKEHKVVVDFHPYVYSIEYYNVLSMIHGDEYTFGVDMMTEDITGKTPREYAYDEFETMVTDILRDDGDNVMTFDYIEKTDEKGNVYYELVINDEDREKIYKEIIDNLDSTIKDEPCKYLE